MKLAWTTKRFLKRCAKCCVALFIFLFMLTLYISLFVAGTRYGELMKPQTTRALRSCDGGHSGVPLDLNDDAQAINVQGQKELVDR